MSFFVELTYSKAMDEVPGSGTSLSLGSVAILSATSFRSPISFGVAAIFDAFVMQGYIALTVARFG